MRKVLIATLVFASSIAVLRIGVMAQNPTVSLPFLVVKDAMGVVVGPVVQIVGDFPIILFRDPTDGGAPFFLEFGKEWFGSKDAAVINYTGPGCSGTPYIDAPVIPRRGVPRMRETSYARGPNGVIYRTIREGRS